MGNFLYGLYATAYEPSPDPATYWVTDQTAMVLTVCGWPTEAENRTDKATTELSHDGRRILAVYEGCNGLNVMIIFVAFLFAFGPINKTLLWFIPLGLLIIHLMNLARIALLQPYLESKKQDVQHTNAVLHERSKRPRTGDGGREFSRFGTLTRRGRLDGDDGAVARR